MAKKSSKQILAETMMELAKTKPVERITIREIVQSAGLSTQTFYNHFADRDALILYVHTSALDVLIDKLYSDDYDFRDMIHEYLRFYSDHLDYLKMAMIYSHGKTSHFLDFGNYVVEQTCKYLCHVMNVEQLPEDMRCFVRIHVFGQIYMYAHWAWTDAKIPLNQLEDYLVRATPPALAPYFYRECRETAAEA